MFHVREIWNSNKVKEKSAFFKLNLPFKDFLFYLFTYFSKHLAEAKNKRKINKGKSFAILEFACKMSVQEAEGKKKARLSQIHRFESECLVLLQKLSSKMLERCPLQHSVVLESRMSHPK